METAGTARSRRPGPRPACVAKAVEVVMALERDAATALVGVVAKVGEVAIVATLAAS